MSSMNATHCGRDAAPLVGGAQRVDDAARRPGARRAGARPRGISASAAGTQSLSAAAPRLPPTTSRRSGPARPAKRASRRRHAADRVAQRIADPLDLAGVPAAHRVRKAEQDPVGAVGEHAIGESRDRVGVVQHQRLARSATPTSAPGNDAKPPKPEHDVGRAAADDLARSATHAASSANGPSSSGPPALAAHAAERDALELDAVLRHERAFHAVARAEPEHAPAARDELRRDGESRERRGRRCRRW